MSGAASPTPVAPLIATGAYSELAFLALANLVPGVGGESLHTAASLHDPRLLRWVTETLPEPAWKPLADDAALVSRIAGAASDAELLALQWLPVLHDDLDQFVSTGRFELGALAESSVADPMALGCLRAAPRPVVELIRCAMLLCASAWAEARVALVAPELERARGLVEPWLRQATALAPALARHRVELVHALGPRGRAFAGRLFVGAPCAWNGLPAEHAAVQALHEAAVLAAGSGNDDARRAWQGSEAVALAVVAELVRGSPFASAVDAWSARFDLRALPHPDETRVAAAVRALRTG